MEINQISPDQVELWRWGFVSLNLTILYTWVVMALLIAVSWLATRRLSSGPRMSRWQNLLEIIVGTINSQIRDVSHQQPQRYLPFIGTLFLFIAVSNLLAIVPGFVAPTGSLSTTAALAICVFLAVPIYGIASQGLLGYLRQYLRPTPLMLPFNVIGELSRTLALAVRLFGNMMSGAKIAAILLAIVPLFFPIVMQALGLLTGLIQAYIFAILATVYIASATQARERAGPSIENRAPAYEIQRAGALSSADPQLGTWKGATNMDNLGLIGMASIITAGLTIAIGSIGPALGEGRALADAGYRAIAQQPDETNRITRTLFVGLAMVESTAIYCFVVSLILIFANPFWDHVVEKMGG